MGEEFEKRVEKIEAFKIELKTLTEKYNLGLHKSDHYNGKEEYCGTSYNFTVDGRPFYHQTIAEILDEITSQH